MMDKSRVGECYKLNYEYIMMHPEYILVHGYITNIIPPYQTIDHAWCMKDNLVYDAVHDKEYEWEIYQSLFRAEIAKQYTILEYETYGCWHKTKILNLDKYYDKDRNLKEKYRKEK